MAGKKGCGGKKGRSGGARAGAGRPKSARPLTTSTLSPTALLDVDAVVLAVEEKLGKVRERAWTEVCGKLDVDFETAQKLAEAGLVPTLTDLLKRVDRVALLANEVRALPAPDTTLLLGLKAAADDIS